MCARGLWPDSWTWCVFLLVDSRSQHPACLRTEAVPLLLRLHSCWLDGGGCSPVVAAVPRSHACLSTERPSPAGEVAGKPVSCNEVLGWPLSRWKG